MLRAIALALLVASLTATDVIAADMATWEAATHARCPSRHLDWTCDGCWDDYLSDFEQALSKPVQAEIARIADYNRRCSKETAGFSCEMSVHVDALTRLRLLSRFVAWGCAHYQCDYAASCRRLRAPAVRR